MLYALELNLPNARVGCHYLQITFRIFYRNKMSIFQLLRLKVFFIIMFIVPAKAFTQHLGKDIFLAVNTPAFFYFGDISKFAKNNAIGFSLASRIFLANKLAVIPSIRYDNFKYKPLDKRIGDYAQFKIGLTYFGKFSPIRFLLNDSTIKNYFLVDCGIGVKLNSEMIGNKNCFAYSIGYGATKIYRNKIILDMCTEWVSLKLANGINASWLDYRIGLGYRL